MLCNNKLVHAFSTIKKNEIHRQNTTVLNYNSFQLDTCVKKVLQKVNIWEKIRNLVLQFDISIYNTFIYWPFKHMYKSSYVQSLELNKPQRDSSRLTEIFYNATHIINTCILSTYVHVASFFKRGMADEFLQRNI